MISLRICNARLGRNLGLFFIVVSNFTNPNITESKRVTVPLQTHWTFLGMILGRARQPLPNPLCTVALIAGDLSCMSDFKSSAIPLRNVGDSNSNGGSLVEQPPSLP